MVEFKSLIILDLETTSLPQLDHNTTKITELAFLGCEIEHLKESEELPRVLHKLVLLFYPNKPISPDSTNVSGLSNEMLMNLRPFRQEDVEIMKHFISRLPPPVCIVAHNGDNFDFPILKRAIQKVNMELQNHVYCLDSIKAFRTLLPVADHSLPVKCSDMKTSNELTPKHQPTHSYNSQKYKKVCRNLFPDDDELAQIIAGQDLSNALNASQSSHTSKSFKLKDIYYFYFGGYFVNSHRAEEDAKALLYCVKKCEGFLDWMNKNAIIFNCVKSLF